MKKTISIVVGESSLSFDIIRGLIVDELARRVEVRLRNAAQSTRFLEGEETFEQFCARKETDVLMCRGAVLELQDFARDNPLVPDLPDPFA